MKVNIICGAILCCLSSITFSKTANPLCATVTGSDFPVGNGTLANPFLICNTSQINQIGKNNSFLNKSYIMGADLNFTGITFQMIGSANTPFQGSFDGAGYTLSNISLALTGNNIAVFPAVINGVIKNLNLNGMTNLSQGTFFGGLIATAVNSQITNIRITNLTMNAPDFSGGLIGQAQNCVVSNSSVQGTMQLNFGTDSGGGLIGDALNVKVSSCAVHVNMVETFNTAYGVSAIGGVFGSITNSTVSNCYADGNIDFSSVTSPLLPDFIGGFSGISSSTAISNSYYAGKLTVKANDLGGAIGALSGTIIPTNLYWDTVLSGVTKSAAGLGQTTCMMKQKSFWTSLGFSSAIWILKDGAYPKLVTE